MVAPVVPWDVHESLMQQVLSINGGYYGVPYYVKDRYGYKQHAPYNIDTPLYYTRTVVKGENHWGASGVFSFFQQEQLKTEAANKARAKFVAQLGSTSQLGSTLTAEFKSSYRTVVIGIATALKAARLVAKGDLVSAARHLSFFPPTITKRITRTYKRKVNASNRQKRKRMTIYRRYWQMPGGREVLQTSGNRWLWYSYGVKPLVEDLYNASKVFTREVPGTKVVGKGFAVGQTSPSIDHYFFRHNVKISAYVRVINPNLWLANQLGLINPFQIVNEGITFSFVVDWFSNWSDWLQQLTDFVGLEIVKPNTIYISRTTRTWHAPREFVKHFVEEQFTLQRVLSIPSVKLQFKYERFSLQRGANAVSLLAQFFKTVRK